MSTLKYYLVLVLLPICLGQFIIDQQKISSRYVSPNGITDIPVSENLDFDSALYDNTIWWDSTNKHWIAGEEGLYELHATVTFDQSDTPNFPTSNVYDHQIHAIVNNSYPANLFLDVFTTKGNGINTWQQRLSGSNYYFLSLGESIAVRIQTRIYPTSVVNSTIDGGPFSLTQATLKYWGKP